MPATRSRSPRATTARAPTSSPSSTSPRAPTSATSCCTSSRRWRARCSSRSPSAAACARWRTCGACSTPAPTRCRSTPSAVQNPELVRETSGIVGNQAIVVAIDAKKNGASWEVFTHGGRKPTGLDAVEWARRMVEAGAGEILLTSMDRDGTREGFDLALTRAVSRGGQRAGDRLRRRRLGRAPRRRRARGARRRGARGERVPLRRFHRAPGEGAHAEAAASRCGCELARRSAVERARAGRRRGAGLLFGQRS